MYALPAQGLQQRRPLVGNESDTLLGFSCMGNIPFCIISGEQKQKKQFILFLSTLKGDHLH